MISLHVHVLVCASLRYMVRWCIFATASCVYLYVRSVSLWINWSNMCQYKRMRSACAFEPSWCHFVLVILLFLSFQKMICVPNWTFWSVRREHYTIGKSGLKHQERQNSQSWAHKLHWCGIIWFFACGASLPSPCAVLLLFCHLSYPDLTSKYTVFSLLYSVWLCASFVLMSLHSALCLYVVLVFLFLHFVFHLSTGSQSFGSQSAWLAVWRVSGSSHPDMITSQLHKSEPLCCFLPQCWGTWMEQLMLMKHADSMSCSPICISNVSCASCLSHLMERRWIEMRHAVTTSVQEVILIWFLISNCFMSRNVHERLLWS